MRFHLAALWLALPFAPGTPVSNTISQCTAQSMSVRREWGALSKLERLDYRSAVKCLMETPSKMPPGLAPAAKSRYDDFTALHINRTTMAHYSGIFLTFHRYFIHLFEQALQQECGYLGSLPYWNWTLSAGNMSASPIFDGSETSLGSDGVPDASMKPITNMILNFTRANGGGAIANGPFANLTTNFRRFDLKEGLTGGPTPADAFVYAPHPVTRDLNDVIAGSLCTNRMVDHLLHNIDNIAEWQEYMNMGDFGLRMGIHTCGHFSVGLDMFDLFAATVDPVFYLHHGMLDLIYAQWQAQDFKRYVELDGTVTIFNSPPSQNVTLDYELDFWPLADPIRVGDLMKIDAGPFCYRYEGTLAKR